ncbi:alpha/beta hydrolase [Lactococcus lactis]|uniref:Alpha/beta hydrolase n=1 Tax=Lactococcus lactis TaxID=1358 RepID=A0AAP3YZL9_9LACT|nr:alpha/beta hydrolase [Lactococcus lactis]MDG4968969.1 alpha/beta hydrolase [Lactococcus lactis]MDG4975654.1 alpha/beta hydrolase [Lactococcus lactis]MDG5103064.1 alpha/beta hydrolase [Lactococcus lactis]
MTQKPLPLILIPGTDANGNRFDSFMNELMKQVGKKDILKINVKTDGTTEYTSSLGKDSTNPFIVISFSDSSENGVDRQAKWTEVAMKKAHQLYSFKSYNALGHSNGGLVWTIYLENAAYQSSSQMKSLITLGTPYNYLDPKANPYPDRTSLTETDMLKQMISKREKLPNSLKMISIGGNYKEDSDGIVPLTSALSSSRIYKEKVASYSEKIFNGDNARHNMLTENPEVINYIIHTLY